MICKTCHACRRLRELPAGFLDMRIWVGGHRWDTLRRRLEARQRRCQNRGKT